MASVSPGGGVPGLEAALTVAGLEGHYVAARAWCEQMGARFLEELAEDEVLDMFAEELKLKPLEKRRFRKAVTLSGGAGSGGGYAGAAAAAPPLAPAATDPAGAEAAKVAATAAVVSKGPAVFVKNTFLDLDEGERLKMQALRRLSTEPTPEIVHDDSDDDEEQGDDFVPPEVQIPASSSQSPAGPPEMPGLYKTMTCDGYEPRDEWAWVDGDPNAPTGAEAYGEATREAAGESGGLAPVGESEYGLGTYGGAEAYAAPHVLGVVMVPTEVLPPHGMAAVPGPCFPGCVAVPMDRFARWPCVPIASEPAAPAKPEARKNVLSRAFSVASSINRINWTVDARKLKSNDTEAVSPSFDLAFEGAVAFKMILRPRVTSETKGGASFKKARGRGTVELRCLDSVEGSSNSSVTFRVSIGSPADSAKQQAPRGPVRHDFAQRAICGLPRGQEEWNFSQAVDKETQTFVVCLEVLRGSVSDDDSASPAPAGA